MERNNTHAKKGFKIDGSMIVLLCALVLVIGVFTCLNKNYFSYTNLVNVFVAASLVGLVAIGETYLIIAGLNDLSPGSVAAFSGVLAALLTSMWGLNFGVSLIITILVAAAAGVFNAWMIANIKLQPFIATLVTQAIFRGLAYIICDGKPISVTNETFINLGKARIGGSNGIPITVILLIAAFLVFGFILSRTRFGRSIYAIGGNINAARLAGLKPNKIIYTSYLIISSLCAVGGTILAARMNSGQPAACVNLEFDAITAVILGGVSFNGGIGNMFGTFLGVILIEAFNTGLTMVQVPTFWQYVARGLLLLAALTIDYVRKTNREKKLLADSMKNL